MFMRGCQQRRQIVDCNKSKQSSILNKISMCVMEQQHIDRGDLVILVKQ